MIINELKTHKSITFKGFVLPMSTTLLEIDSLYDLIFPINDNMGTEEYLIMRAYKKLLLDKPLKEEFGYNTTVFDEILRRMKNYLGEKPTDNDYIPNEICIIKAIARGKTTFDVNCIMQEISNLSGIGKWGLMDAIGEDFNFNLEKPLIKLINFDLYCTIEIYNSPELSYLKNNATFTVALPALAIKFVFKNTSNLSVGNLEADLFEIEEFHNRLQKMENKR